MIIIAPLFLVILLHQKCTATSEQTDCTVSGDTLTCIHQLPNNIPSNVSKVVIKDYLNTTIDSLAFNGTNWDKITSLDITVNTIKSFSLDQNNFIFLRRGLTYLGIHAPNLHVIHAHSFGGLTHLRALDLSYSVYINGTQLTTAILESKLNLVELSLCYISSARPLQMDQKFMQMLSSTNIQSLILSGSVVMLKGPFNSENLTFKIHNFDLSNTTLSVTDLSLESEVKVMTLLLQHVESLDLSYTNSRALELNYQFLLDTRFFYKCKTYKFLEIFYKTQHLFLNGLAQYDIYGNNSIVDMSICIVRLKSLHLKDNKIVYLNTTVKWPIKNDFETIDLSDNHMKYLNPGFFTGLTKLKVLDLSNNRLYEMEKSESFATLLQSFPELRACNLSHNNLTSIPKQMFINNTKIITLDLSNNKLTSITFHVRQFKDIKELILRNNSIVYLKGTDLNKLSHLLQKRLAIDLDITENPFECTCRTVKFQQWVISKLQPQSNNVYTCNQYDTTLTIGYGTIEKSEYLCKRTAIIIGVICGSIALVTVIVFAVVALHKMNRAARQRQARSSFINEIARGKLPQKYLCFLSFSSNEDSNLITEVSGSIDENLRLLTGVSDRTLVCIGDRNFRPGYPLINEIYRLVNESFVTVCLVSRLFCASRWCELEMRAAEERNKPILLIFTETVKRKEMPDIMQHIFDTRTRARLVNEKNTYILIPGYDILSSSILDLAIKDFANLRNAPDA